MAERGSARRRRARCAGPWPACRACGRGSASRSRAGSHDDGHDARPGPARRPRRRRAPSARPRRARGRSDQHGDLGGQVDEAGHGARGEGGGRQVERDRLAGDESSSPGQMSRLACTGSPPAYVARVDLDAYVGAHRQEWARLEELSRRRPAHRRGGRRAGRPVPARSPPTCPWSAPRAPDAAPGRHLSGLLARARAAVDRHPDRPGATSPVLTASFPAALYRTRRWWLGATAVRLRRARRGDDRVAARAPGRRSRRCSPRQVASSSKNDFAELLQRVRRLALRGPGVDQQRLGRGALHRPRRARAAGRLRAVVTTSSTSAWSAAS